MPKKPPKGLTRAGEILRANAKTKALTSVTPAKEKFIDAAAAIRQDPDDTEAAFLARQLVQCTLPHSDPGNVPAWSRRNGNLTLAIKPGSDQAGKSFGIPFGSIPRLLLFWVTTAAVQTKSRRLELGHNLADFMRAVGLDPNTGRGVRSDARRLRNQMERLFRATISFDVTMVDGDRRGAGWLDMQVAPKGEFWWDPKRPEEGVLWGSWIELGEPFYNAIKAAPVPVDRRALRALKRSPLALDLYALAVHTSYTANKNGAQFITWAGLRQRLGADYDPKRIDHFKEKVKTALRKVAAVFPAGLRYEWQRGGLTFLPGTKLPIPPAPTPPLWTGRVFHGETVVV